MVHLESKTQRTDPQKAEIQERRNALMRRINLWKTAQAIYMPPVSGYLVDERGSPTSSDPYEHDGSKPELWPLFLPSQLSQGDRSSCHNGIAETEHTLRLAQVQDNLVDLRRLRRTLRNLRMYFRANIVGEGQKAQTKSRSIEAGVQVRINRAVRRYHLARAALLSLDPTGDWLDEYPELTDKDNRGPGKEIDEQGVGDGRYKVSWIWKGTAGNRTQDCFDLEVNEIVRHEWMTCRARADRWKEETELLHEEMRRIIAFLEWKSNWWHEKVGSRLGLVPGDIQHGIDSYARRQENTYHELAVSLANQWLPHLLRLGLDTAWAKTYPWATEIYSPVSKHPPGPPNVHGNPSRSGLHSEGVAPANEEREGIMEPADSDDDSGDESSDEVDLDVDEGGILDEGEISEGFGAGFEYDNEYMA